MGVAHEPRPRPYVAAHPVKRNEPRFLTMGRGVPPI